MFSGTTLRKVKVAALAWFASTGAALLLAQVDAVSGDLVAGLGAGGFLATSAAYLVREGRGRLVAYLRERYGAEVH